MAKIISTETDERGHEIVTYESGAKYDKDAGRLVHPATANMITKENAAAMYQRRREISEQRARDAIDMAAIEAGKLDLSKMGTGEGWYQLVLHTARTFMQSSNLRGMAEIFGKLGMSAGYLSTQRLEIENKHTYDVSDNLRELTELMRQALAAKNTDATDGEVINADPTP